MRTIVSSARDFAAERARVRALVPVALFLTVFAVYLCSAPRDGIHVDAQAATVEAWHIAATGSPWLEGDLTDWMESNEFIGLAPNGHTVALRAAGPVIAGLPFYWLLDDDEGPHGFSLAPGSLAASTLVALAVLFLFLALRTLVSQRVAITCALAFALTTPTWTVSAAMLWTHTVTQLGICGAAFASSRQRWWLAGVFLGAGMLARPHLAVIAALLGVGVALARRSTGPAVAVAIPSCFSLALVSIWNRWMFGGWSLGGGYGRRPVDAAINGSGAGGNEALASTIDNLAGFLVSLDRGILLWTPVLLLTLGPVVHSWQVLPDWTRWMLLGGLVYTVLQLRLNPFHGGDGFWGYRHGLELLTCAVPAITCALPRLGGVARFLLPPTLALQFAVVVVGAVLPPFFVPVEDVWADNSLWLTFRHHPTMIGSWLSACLCLGLLIALRLEWGPGGTSDSEPVPSTGTFT